MTTDEEAVHALIESENLRSRLIDRIDAVYAGATLWEVDPVVTGREFEQAVTTSGVTTVPEIAEIYRTLRADKLAGAGHIGGTL
ncbi:hypothetical protein ACWEOE_10700 [Amycolatopsis sp. NPDC004368]